MVAAPVNRRFEEELIMSGDAKQPHTVVDEQQWIAERKRLLEKEKTYTRLRDEVTRARQAMPWRKIEKDYVFRSNKGEIRFGELFGPQSQLLVYHFMVGKRVALVYLAEVELRRGHYDDALDAVREAMKLMDDPSASPVARFQAHFLLAQALAGQGDTARARDEGRTALQFFSARDDPDSRRTTDEIEAFMAAL